MNTLPALRTLVTQLAGEGLVGDTQARGMALMLETPMGRTKPPWYLRMLIGLGALTVAVLLVVFLIWAELVESEESCTWTGLILCCIAVGLKQFLSRGAVYSEFLEKLALALVLTGQILTIGGIRIRSDSDLTTALVILALEGLLIGIYPDRLQRFLSALVCGGAFSVLLYEISIPFAGEWACVLLVALASWIWLEQARIQARAFRLLDPAVGYGALMAAFGMLLLADYSNDLTSTFELSQAYVTVGLSSCLLWIVYRIFQELPARASSRTMAAAFAGAALLGFLTHPAPGIVAAAAALLLGFHRRDSRLTGLGVAFLVIFGIVFYYQLELTLLHKSAMLFASGALLLGLRSGLHRLLAIGEA